ncbi:DNA polymerase/3'-5' exonuclease PolX [candidate division NPL-UPA2 bacterium]|nr:DNA polymerase/3'-5' exonuclease PolX [candidate division NPL-UPA2 bacterium]
MRNSEIASIFSHIADILEIKGENPFRVRAYQKVVRVLESLTEEVEEIYKAGELKNISGVGEGIAKKIEEVLTTGKLQYYEDLKESVPSGLVELLNISEVGPKTASLLYKELGINSVKDLEKAVKGHRIKDLPGMGEKTEENIRRGIELLKRKKGRMLLGKAYPLARSIIDSLKRLSEVNRISPAGSLRRMKETIGDIDILVTSRKPAKVMQVFLDLPQVTEVLASGETKSSIIMKGGLQVDVRVVKPDSFGAALQYFTGSKPHNIKLRELANKRGLKINEYGVFKINGGKKVAGTEEKDVYVVLDLPYIPPELREDRGEIEAGQEGSLPELVELKSIKGDLHVHSKWSDGSDTIMELAEAARKLKYQYIAICDHSKSLGVAGGLSEEDLKRQIAEVRKVNEKLNGFRVLAGSEVDIRSDGRLDFEDDILKELDIVIASIHTGFKQDRKTMTNRIIRAMNNKFVHVLAHPTGRLLHEREPYQVDMEAIIEEAKRTGTFLELNAFPDRLDLNDVHCRRAKEEGVMVTLGTDAHHKTQLEAMYYGVATARRAWLEDKDVLNTLSLKDLLKKLKRR